MVPAEDRRVVQVLNHRLARYVENAFGRYGLGWAGMPGQVLELPAAAIAALPTTAARAIGNAAVAAAVRATCETALPAGDGLILLAYRVDGRADVPATGHATVQAPPAPDARLPAEFRRGGRDGARQEILAAARAATMRAGRAEFTMPEIIDEMRRRGTTYSETTIRTMISAHLCAEATGEGVAGYTDMTRIDRGLYRLTRPQGT